MDLGKLTHSYAEKYYTLLIAVVVECTALRHMDAILNGLMEEQTDDYLKTMDP